MSGMIKAVREAEVKESDNLLGDKDPHCTVSGSHRDGENWVSTMFFTSKSRIVHCELPFFIFHSFNLGISIEMKLGR